MTGPYESFDEATNRAVKNIQFPEPEKGTPNDYDVEELKRRDTILRAATNDDTVEAFCREKEVYNGYADITTGGEFVVICFEFAGNGHSSTRYGMFDEFGDWVIE